MKLWKFSLPPALIALLACSHQHVGENGPANYNFSVTDNVKSRQFDLKLVSHDPRDICFPVEQWPARYGGVDSGGQRAWMVVDDQTYPAADRNFGFCPDGCGYIRVKGGKSLSGRVTYDQFAAPEQAFKRLDKHLRYEIFPKVCESDMKIVQPRGYDN
jgi:hypothetical protein